VDSDSDSNELFQPNENDVDESCAQDKAHQASHKGCDLGCGRSQVVKNKLAGTVILVKIKCSIV